MLIKNIHVYALCILLALCMFVSCKSKDSVPVEIQEEIGLQESKKSSSVNNEAAQRAEREPQEVRQALDLSIDAQTVDPATSLNREIQESIAIRELSIEKEPSVAKKSTLIDALSDITVSLGSDVPVIGYTFKDKSEGSKSLDSQKDSILSDSDPMRGRNGVQGNIKELLE